MITEDLPKDCRTPEDRKALAEKLVRLIELGEAERENMRGRWEVNRNNYNGDKPSWSNRWLAAEPNHFPLVKPKARALASNVIGTIFSQSPTVLCELQGESSDVSEGLEQQIEYFFDLGRLRESLERAEGLAFVTNNAVIRTTFDVTAAGFMPMDEGEGVGDISYCGPRFDVIDPEDFVCYPKAAGSIQKAQIVGHRFYRQIWEIDEMREAGLYLDDGEVVPTQPDEGDGGARFTDEESPEVKEQLAECWEVIFKDDLDDIGNRRWYKASLERESKQLLKVDAYDLRRPWYTFVRYTPPDVGSCWSEHSLAQDLQGLQWEKNNIRNLMVYGSFMAAFPPVASTRTTPHVKDKVQKYGPGVVLSDPNARSLAVEFNPGTLENELERIERDADAIIGIGQAGTGAQFKSGTTATEAAYIQSSQQTGVKQFISTFGQSVTDIAETLAELLMLEFGVWSTLHEGQVWVQEEDLKQPVRWQLHGSSPDMLPQVLLEKYKFILEQLLMEKQMVQPGMPAPPPRFDEDELWRSIMNQLQIPNRDKIMPPTQGRAPDAAMGMAPQQMAGGADAGMGGVLPVPGMDGGAEAFGIGEEGPGFVPAPAEPYA